ncbi:MAG: DUF3301 domain-containing protein [Thiohalomonadaceae bacterium]
MTIEEALILLLIIGAVVGWWFNALRARDVALRAARTACQRHDLQLLDETVAVVRIRPARDPAGHMGLRRWYRFEFSDDNENRREGRVEVLGRRAYATHLDLAPFTLHEFEKGEEKSE